LLILLENICGIFWFVSEVLELASHRQPELKRLNFFENGAGQESALILRTKRTFSKVGPISKHILGIRQPAPYIQQARHTIPSPLRPDNQTES